MGPRPGPQDLVPLDPGNFAALAAPDEAGPSGLVLDLWRYRELLALLAWRTVAVRYKQTAFGMAWALVQPLTSSGIFAILLGSFGGLPSDHGSYFLATLAAMLPWTFFQNGVTAASQSLLANPSLVTHVYLPRIVIPVSALAASLVDLAVTLVPTVLLLAWRGDSGGPLGLLLLLPVSALTLLLTGAVGTALAALSVRYRDLRFVVPFVLQCWMFATPVVYASSLVPPQHRAWLALNPLTGLVEGYRAALLGGPFPATQLAASLVGTLLVSAAAGAIFRSLERELADVL